MTVTPHSISTVLRAVSLALFGLLASCGASDDDPRTLWTPGSTAELRLDWRNCVTGTNADFDTAYQVGGTNYRHLGWACADHEQYADQRIDHVLVEVPRDDGTLCWVPAASRPRISEGQCYAPLQAPAEISVSVTAAVDARTCGDEMPDVPRGTCLTRFIVSESTVALAYRSEVALNGRARMSSGPDILLPGERLANDSFHYDSGVYESGLRIDAAFEVTSSQGGEVLARASDSHVVP